MSRVIICTENYVRSDGLYLKNTFSTSRVITYLYWILLLCANQSFFFSFIVRKKYVVIIFYSSFCSLQVVPVIIRHISQLSSVRVYLPKDIRSLESRNTVRRSLQGVYKKFPDGPPLLDPSKDMHIQDEDFKKIVKVGEIFIGGLVRNHKFSLPKVSPYTTLTVLYHGLDVHKKS